jgi:Tol biopolymer transport system component
MMASPFFKALLISVRLFAIASFCFGLSLIPGDTHAAADTIVQLVSISSDGGNNANGGSHAPAISGDGRFVVFLSEASNLVPDDNNGLQDVFVHDLWTRTTTLVSRNYDGGPANGEPSRPSISANGDFVVYSSEASNVFPGDRNDASDVFLYHRHTGVTELISVNSAGEIGNKNSFTRRPSVTNDGRYVVFFSNSTKLDEDYILEEDSETYHVYLRDRLLGTTELISKNADDEIGDGNSEYPTISADGSAIAFHSFAINLTEDKDDNETSDVFLYDVALGTITRISNTPDGWAGNDASDLAALSADGGRVAFVSVAEDLLPPGEDNNNTSDIFIYTAANQTIQRVSVSSLGAEGNAISDVPSLSDTGRYVAFYSFADNLVVNDTNECTEDTNKKRSCTDVFRHDTYMGETIRVSLSASGVEGNDDSLCSGINADGQVFVFYSYATNLVADDANNLHDVFVYSLRPIVRRYYFPLLYQNAPQP